VEIFAMQQWCIDLQKRWTSCLHSKAYDFCKYMESKYEYYGSSQDFRIYRFAKI
jgi:hypothetical protein